MTRSQRAREDLGDTEDETCCSRVLMRAEAPDLAREDTSKGSCPAPFVPAVM